MPFVTRYVRLTNSGKLPDIFLTSKVQTPTDLADAKLGKLFFVLQINRPWNSVATLGSSIINLVTREYFRQEGHVPLENFEKAIAKVNSLIDQLAREGESSFRHDFHALIALVVGDELHLAFTGEAEAYFLRHDKIGQITNQNLVKSDNDQVFNNLISGEISTDDKVILGSPGVYSGITSEDLRVILKQPVLEATKEVARRLKGMKIRNANALVIHFNSLKKTEDEPINAQTETVYLDQAVDSVGHIVSYNLSRLLRPVGALMGVLGKQTAAGARKASQQISMKTKTHLVPHAQKLLEKTGKGSTERLKDLSVKGGTSFASLQKSLKTFKKFKPEIPQFVGSDEGAVPINHYGKRSSKAWYKPYLKMVLDPLMELGKQFRQVIKRNPRAWYIIIALVLLSSIGASVQSRKDKPIVNPVVPTASFEEMKKLLADAKQAKTYGDSTKARILLAEAIVKGDEAKQSSKLVNEASSLIGQAERDLDTLAGATRLSVQSPIIGLPTAPTQALIYEGIIYFPNNNGQLQSMLLTGGEAQTVAELPGDESINQMVLDSSKKVIYVQNYLGTLYQYSLSTKKLTSLESVDSTIPVSTSLGIFNQTLYLLDPASQEIWKYLIEDSGLGAAGKYLKTSKVDLANAKKLAIDGSIFTLHEDGAVNKFSRGNQATFSVTNLPAPFDKTIRPLGFFADEDANSYYLADQGDAMTPARIIELDKSGKFVHQYFLPKAWQNDIKLVVANPKSHKAWILVDKQLYEYTLVQ